MKKLIIVAAVLLVGCAQLAQVDVYKDHCSLSFSAGSSSKLVTFVTLDDDINKTITCTITVKKN